MIKILTSVSGIILNMSLAHGQPQHYVSYSEVLVYSNPSIHSEVVETLTFGDRVTLLTDSNDGWARVRLHTKSKIGYLNSHAITTIAPQGSAHTASIVSDQVDREVLETEGNAGSERLVQANFAPVSMDNNESVANPVTVENGEAYQARGYLHEIDPIDLYRIDLPATALVQIGLSSEQGDADLTLFNSDMTEIAESTEVDSAVDLVEKKLTSGTYFIQASGHQDLNVYGLEIKYQRYDLGQVVKIGETPKIELEDVLFEPGVSMDHESASRFEIMIYNLLVLQNGTLEIEIPTSSDLSVTVYDQSLDHVLAYSESEYKNLTTKVEFAASPGENYIVHLTRQAQDLENPLSRLRFDVQFVLKPSAENFEGE